MEVLNDVLLEGGLNLIASWGGKYFRRGRHVGPVLLHEIRDDYLKDNKVDLVVLQRGRVSARMKRPVLEIVGTFLAESSVCF